MWQLILKAEPSLPIMWGGLLEKWAKGDAQIPTDLKLDELREHWAEQDPPVVDYTSRSASNLRKIINQIKEELPNAPDEVGRLADGLVEVMIQSGKSKGQIKSVITKLEKLYNQIDPPNKYYNISVGHDTLESLNLVSTRGKNAKDWLEATLNKLYNKFTQDSSFENMRWLVKIVEEMQKEKPYQGKGAIGKLIKKPKDTFALKLSKYQAGADAMPTQSLDAMKTAFGLSGDLTARKIQAPTRAGLETVDSHSWTARLEGETDEELEERMKEVGSDVSVEGLGETHRAGTRTTRTKTVTAKTPSLEESSIITPLSLKEIKGDIKEIRKNVSDNKEELKKVLGKDIYLSLRNNLSHINLGLVPQVTPLETTSDSEVYTVPADIESLIANMSITALRKLHSDLVKAGVHDKLQFNGRYPLNYFEKRGISILHQLAFGDARTQDIISQISPIDKITKDVSGSLSETRKQNQKQFIEEWLEKELESKGAKSVVAGITLNDPTTAGEKSRRREAVDKLSSELSEGTNENLNRAWHKYLNRDKKIQTGTYVKDGIEYLNKPYAVREGEGTTEHSIETTHEILTSSDVENTFNTKNLGMFQRNMFLTLLFKFYESDDDIGSTTDFADEIMPLLIPKKIDIPSHIRFAVSDADSFLEIIQVLLSFLNIWLPVNQEVQDYETRIGTATTTFAHNINEFLKQNVKKGRIKPKHKKKMLNFAITKEEGVNSLGGMKDSLFGAKNDLAKLEKELTDKLKLVAVEVVPAYFRELIEQIGSNEIKSTKKQLVPSSTGKVTIKEKLLELGFLTRD